MDSLGVLAVGHFVGHGELAVRLVVGLGGLAPLLVAGLGGPAVFLVGLDRLLGFPLIGLGELPALRELVRVAFGGRYSDLCYGYNAFWRRVLPVLDGEADGFEIETLMNVRALAAGLRVAEVPSHEARRIHGVSNLNTWSDGYRVLGTIVRERRNQRGRRLPAGSKRRLSNGSPVIDALSHRTNGASQPEGQGHAPWRT